MLGYPKSRLVLVAALTVAVIAIAASGEFTDLLFSAAQETVGASGFIGEESEPNDTPAEANALSVGDTLSASFQSGGDVDWFRFHLEALHMYYLTSIESQPGVEPDIELYLEGDYQSNLLTSPVRGRNGAGDFRLSGFVPSRSGEYYAKISDFTSNPGPYKLRLVGGRAVEELIAHEPDNSLAAVAGEAPLAPNDTVFAALFPANDADFYKIEGKAGWLFEAGVFPVKGLGIRDTDTFLYLLDSQGVVIEQNDDRGGEPTSTGESQSNTFSLISSRFPNTGTYYLKVESYYTSARGAINENRPGTGEYGISYSTREPSGDDQLVKGPYLQNVFEDRITIMWETLFPSASRVEYGRDESLGKSATTADPVTIHEVTLTGLSTETVYYYRVQSDTLFSETNTFRTRPLRDTPFRLAVYGDNRTDVSAHAAVVQSIIRSQPDLVVNVGDVVTNGDNHSEWSREFFTPAHDLMVNTPLYVAIGNHERNAHWFYDYYSFPPPENYYSFNYGNAHFIILDTNGGTNYSPDSDQYRWLISDLDSDDCRKAEWVFVFFHHPPWSQMWDSPGYTGTANVREWLVPVLEAHPVDMVFSGHTHDYERGFRNGVYYIISGGGGSALDRVVTGDWPHIAVWLSEYHHTVLDIDGKEVAYHAITPDGEIIDSLRLSKGVSEVSEPAPSGGLPDEFALHQNYPNPFNPATQIVFDLPESAFVDVRVLDLTGSVVAVLERKLKQAGTHTISWNGRDRKGDLAASGLYFCHLKSPKFTKTIKMTLVR